MSSIQIPSIGIPGQVTAEEIHAAPQPTDRQVWAICPYVSQRDRCRGCPSSEEDEELGQIQRGCRAMAEEACRVVMATSG